MAEESEGEPNKVLLSEDEEENQKRFDNHDRNVNEEKQNEITRYKVARIIFLMHNQLTL